MVRVRDLHFGYRGGDFELRIAELTIQAGTTTAIVGPSGSGKTTLLNLIAGIVTPRAGRIEAGGVTVSELSDRERRNFRIANVGLVFQEFELLEYLNVLDNILLPYRINASLRLDRAVRERAVGLARKVGIADKLHRYPRQLSQGERQRVAVCRSVIPDPSLLLADEPTGNLDPANTDLVFEILFEYVERNGATLLTVTHDRELLPRFGSVVDFRSEGGVS